jgi:hypothetical protein
MVNPQTYYGEYHGHLVEDLAAVHGHLKTHPERVCCFLVGDSSLDNKFWLHGKSAPAINGYETVLSGKKKHKMVKDCSVAQQMTAREVRHCESCEVKLTKE